MRRHKILYLVLITIFFWSCTKIDTTTIGSGLIPAVDNVNTFDTSISVIANNFDPQNTDCFHFSGTDDYAMGFINNDPYFGQTGAVIYTELKPGVFPFYWPAAASKMTLDSVVLVLSYKSSYGDTTSPQKVEVEQVLSNINVDTSTTSCTFFDYDLPVLGSAIYVPQKLKDSVFSFNERSKNQLRIKLNNSLGQLFLSQDSTSGKLYSDSLFKTLFKGFAIYSPSSFGGNSISFFNVADTNTKLAFYYRYPKVTGGGDTTVVTNFRLSGLSRNSNNIRRTRNNAEINQHLSQPAVGDDQIYIQTTPGTYAQIKIPDLENVSNRIIHRAELIMEQVYSSSSMDGFFATPNFLYLDVKDTTSYVKGGYRPFRCDLNIDQPDFYTFGGYRTLAKDNFGNSISRYFFNITRYVQHVITFKKSSKTLRLRAPAYIYYPAPSVPNTSPINDECGDALQSIDYYYPVNQPVSGRVKLGGGNNANYKMKLRIVYSKL